MRSSDLVMIGISQNINDLAMTAQVPPADEVGEYLSKLLKLNDAGDKFVLKTKKSQDHFIKLMSDDYLESELTKIQYDSLAKDKLS